MKDKKKKSNPVMKTVKRTIVGGTGLMVGSMVTSKVAHLAPGNAHVAGIESSVQGAYGIGAVGLPVGAAGDLMGQIGGMFDNHKPVKESGKKIGTMADGRKIWLKGPKKGQMVK